MSSADKFLGLDQVEELLACKENPTICFAVSAVLRLGMWVVKPSSSFRIHHLIWIKENIDYSAWVRTVAVAYRYVPYQGALDLHR